jgi:ParB-like chromosome segregation protein Spo0J
MTSAHTLPFHPVTEIFPAMDAAAFQALVEDIAQHGQKEPILVLDGQVIDGRHRIQACQQLGRRPLIREIQADEGDPLALVISLNLHRRHLSESQRAMVAGKLANIPNGVRSDSTFANLQSWSPVTQPQAAERLNVSPRSVASARKVLASSAPELIAAVERGVLAVSTAAELTRLPAEEQRQALTRSPEEIRAIARDVNQRIEASEAAGPTVVRIFDRVSQERGLSGLEQMAVAQVIEAEAPKLPSPAEARRLAAEGVPGLMVLANDHHYHGAPLSPEQQLKQERWFKLREGLEALGTVDFDAEAALATVPGYQHANLTAWLSRAVPFLNAFHQLWSDHHA